MAFKYNNNPLKDVDIYSDPAHDPTIANWGTDPNGDTWAEQKPHGFLDHLSQAMPYLVGGTMAAPYIASGIGALHGIAGAGATGTAEEAGGGMSFGSSFGKMFKQFDPTTLLLGGLSLLGKDQDPYQRRQSYSGSGSLTDPKDALYRALSATYRLGQGLTERGPVRLRTPGPAPVQIPGLPFQIGGGLGSDPATPQNVLDQSGVFKYDPFQSVPQEEQKKGRL